MIRKALAIGVLFVVAGCSANAPPPAATAPSRPAIVPIPSAPSKNEPPTFAGLTAQALRTRLGAPAFSRKDGTTDMWRYDTEACHAFFFFTGTQVSHVETVPRGRDDAADPVCLNSLVARPTENRGRQ